MTRAPALLALEPDLAYLWKPPGVPVFPPHGGAASEDLAEPPAGDAAGPDSVLAWWSAQPGFPPEAFPVGFEGGIAHRLDTATSGLLVVARSASALGPLRTLFADRRLRKLYVLRSAASPEQAGLTDRVVELPIAHHPKSRRRMIVLDRPTKQHRGRWYPAWTRFTWLGPDPAGGHLWQAEIRTGVMHQIRVHAQAVGLPLAGDPLYGAGSPGPFLLHHACVLFPDREAPVAPLPDGSAPPLRR